MPTRSPAPTTELVVVGAHLHGEPLHGDLLGRGARFVRATTTAPVYRMVALPSRPAAAGRPPLPARPGLIRDPGAGRAVEVEVYEVPVAALGGLLLTVAPPLAIGTVALAGGAQAPGFVCEGYAREGVPDISHYGGWRRYQAAHGGRLRAEQPP